MYSDLWTVHRIAEHLGVARHRVEYIIASRAIEPIGRAGIARVFDEATVDRVRQEIGRIERGRGGVAL